MPFVKHQRPKRQSGYPKMETVAIPVLLAKPDVDRSRTKIYRRGHIVWFSNLVEWSLSPSEQTTYRSGQKHSVNYSYRSKDTADEENSRIDMKEEQQQVVAELQIDDK